MHASVFSIGKAAQVSGLTVKTIRYYEAIGLIPRAHRGNPAARTGGNRIYTPGDIDRLRFVRNARVLGLGLEDVRDLLAAADQGCPGSQPIYRERLQRHLQTIDERIQHLITLKAAVQALVRRTPRARQHDTRMDGACGCMDVPPELLRAGRAARPPKGTALRRVTPRRGT